MSTTLPLVWSMIPANGNERNEALRLLRLLFELWPDCPMEALVGDSLYDHSVDFAREARRRLGRAARLSNRQGIRRRSPAPGQPGDPELCLRRGDGLQGHRRLRLHRKKRAALGIPRGVTAPRTDGRLRWKCKNGRCKNASTRPMDDPRLYTYYHRGGDHRLAHLRSALLIRRNAVESIFSSLKHLGVGGTDVDRPRGPTTWRWTGLSLLRLAFQTARRLIHETGLYETAHDETRPAWTPSHAVSRVPPRARGGSPAENQERACRLSSSRRAPRSWVEEIREGSR